MLERWDKWNAAFKMSREQIASVLGAHNGRGGLRNVVGHGVVNHRHDFVSICSGSSCKKFGRAGPKKNER